MADTLITHITQLVYATNLGNTPHLSAVGKRYGCPALVTNIKLEEGNKLPVAGEIIEKGMAVLP